MAKLLIESMINTDECTKRIIRIKEITADD
jgi:hypothetical protein